MESNLEIPERSIPNKSKTTVFKSFLAPRTRTPSPSKNPTLRTIPNGKNDELRHLPSLKQNGFMLPADHPHATGKVTKTPRDKENTTPPNTAGIDAPTPIWTQFTADASPRGPLFNAAEKNALKSTELNLNANEPVHQSALQSPYNDSTRADPQSDTPKVGGIRTMGRSWLSSRKSKSDLRAQASKAEPRVERKLELSAVEINSGAQTISEAFHAPIRRQEMSAASTVGSRDSKSSLRTTTTASSTSSSRRTTHNRTKEDEEELEVAFEAILAARNIPEALRQNMRLLDINVKAELVRHAKNETPHHGRPQSATPSSTSMLSPTPSRPARGRSDAKDDIPENTSPDKQSRSRSRGFNLKKGDRSPSKTPRTLSRPRSLMSLKNPSNSSIHSMGLDGARDSKEQPQNSAPTPASPEDFVDYLRQVQQPQSIEIGKIHKLRILTRNESVSWVDAFISQDGIGELLGLLYRIVDIEWREEHEDMLLHEVLLCLRGLCTTQLGLEKLAEVESTLFPRLLKMLFDDERKGPSEYNTRGAVMSLMFMHLAAAPDQFTERAKTLLEYLSDPPPSEEQAPVDFILEMRGRRPYLVWCKEVTNVTKEVFWIFLHHQNVIQPNLINVPDSRPFSTRHFPNERVPVAAAPYVGGVEWEATNYLTTHLKIMNALISAQPTPEDRNTLRRELRASGFEKVMGKTMRTCKEKFYGGVHDGLRTWVAAAVEDGWDSSTVQNGPSREESRSPTKSPKKQEAPPRIEIPVFDLGIDVNEGK